MSFSTPRRLNDWLPPNIPLDNPPPLTCKIMKSIIERESNNWATNKKFPIQYYYTTQLNFGVNLKAKKQR